MRLRTCDVVCSLALLLGVCLVLAPASEARAADRVARSNPERTPEATSPSQEVRAKINEIRRNEFFYQSYGKNDPFRSLVDGDFEKMTGNELVEVSSARLVGVMWSENDRFALVEDGEGFGYILRVGDRVRNGRVVSIRKTALTARITLYGITSSIVLRLEKTEG